MKLYLYNCNNNNEFLEEIETEHPEEWSGCSTDVPVKDCDIVGKSYGFNPQTNDWDVLVDDWRGINLYRKDDSRVIIPGSVGKKHPNFIEIAPPDNVNRYIFNSESGTWSEYVEVVNPAQIIKQYEQAIQKHIDDVAKARGYDNGYTCASYFDDKNARYASDARIFKDWRSDVWVAVNNILNSYSSQLGSMEVVTTADLASFPTIESIIANLPEIEWEEL